MKNRTRRKAKKSPEEIRETDFSPGVRGKHAAALKSGGYTIRVYSSDGSFKERRVAGLRRLIPSPKSREKRITTQRRKR